MNEGLSVPTQASERTFAEELASVLNAWDDAAIRLSMTKVPVDQSHYGVGEAYSICAQGNGRTGEIGKLLFIPTTIRRNILRVPDNHTDGSGFSEVDPDGKLFDRFFWQLVYKLFRSGLVPRPPRDM